MNGTTDFEVEVINGIEGVVGQVVTLEIAPAALDVVEFGSVFRQPLDGEPGRARGERLGCRLAGVDRTVVEDEDDGSVRPVGLRRISLLERGEQGDEVGAAFAGAGLDEQPAGGVIDNAEQRTLLRPAGGLDAQVRASLAQACAR